MSVQAGLHEESVRRERRELLFYTALPYALLAGSTLLTLLQWVWGADVDLPLVLALTAFASLWLLLPAVLRSGRDRGGVGPGLHYAGLLATAAWLVALAPAYGIFAFVGYVQAFLLLPGRWRYAGVAATSSIMAVSYVGGLDVILEGRWALWGAITLVTLLLAGASFYFADSTHRLGRQQKRALVELHEANTRLQAALEENASLHARLLVQAREAGVRDERQRLARDIHDTLAQGLAGILTQLQAAEQTRSDADMRRHMANARELARESLAEARRTIHAVEPEMLAQAELPEAIGEVARRWEAHHRVPVHLTVTGDARPMHPDVESALLRAAQEALTNVAKHARAARVGITLSYMDDLVTLDVRDDGVGFDPAARVRDDGASGFGLAGMRSRVQRLAGRLVVESEPGAGTAVSAAVPAIPAGAPR
ncbi:sensor histidine kinase [Microbacterium album]|uniref:Oxygen sensor histidine kinase NreB n=1 Tax=Microbacterium album TaxID=2053191 RepID=A0A917MMN9_9MICO|nr:sensor histidine kinase [Microbacterium album]GGH36123.1 histidine kinase [Microbacterium album]